MASRKVGGIVAELLLNDRDFRNNLNRSQKLLAQRTAQMRKSFNQVAKRMMAVGAIAGGILVAGLTRAGSRLDDIAKKADAARVAPEVFQGLSRWANRAGVDIGTVTQGMDRLNRRVGRSAAGRGARGVDDALERLNVDAQQLARLSPERQLDRIREALINHDDANERVLLGQELLGNNSSQLISAMVNSGESFEEATEKLERFGIAVNRVDLAKVEESNDAIGELGLLQQGFWDNLRVAAAPAITAVVERILDATEEMGGMGQVAEKVFDGMVKAGGVVGDIFWGWRLAILQVQEVALMLYRTLAGVASQLGVFDKLAEFQHGLDVIGHEKGLRESAKNQLIKEEKIEDIGFTFRDTGERGRLIDERVQEMRQDIEAPEISAPMFSQDFLKDLEDEYEAQLLDVRENLFNQIDKGSPSDRIESFMDGLDELADERAQRVADRVANNNQSLADTADELDEEMENLEEASAAASRELLSLADIATHGSGSMQQLAKRAQELEQQALGQRASGRGEAADRTEERAQELRDRLELRQKGMTPEDIREGGGASAIMDARREDAEAGIAPGESEVTKPSEEGGSSGGWQRAILEMRDAIRELQNQIAVAT